MCSSFVRSRRFVVDPGRERHWEIAFCSVGAIVQGSMNGHTWRDYWLFPKAFGLLVVEMACGLYGKRGPMGNQVLPGWLDLGFPIEMDSY